MCSLRASAVRMRRRSAAPAVAKLAMLLLAGCTLRAAAPVFSALLGGSGQDYATSVTSDAQGNTYVAGLTYSSDFPVTAGAFQTKFGGTSDAFIAKLGPGGNLIWCTYLGGVLDDWATGVALDASGNVLVTGQTRSPNFPLAHPIESIYNNGATDDYDAFVAKLDPNGATLLYSTFLGGNNDDGAAGIAVDAAGDAIVAVTANSVTGFPGIQNPAANQYGIVVSKLDPAGALVYSYFHFGGSAAAIAVDSSGNSYISGTASPGDPGESFPSLGLAGSAQALVFKLSADGTQKLYETDFGGSSQSAATAITVDSTGAAWIGGSTSSVDFPLVQPLQSSPGARPLWSSGNSGATWTPLDNLPFAQPKLLVPDPGTPTTLYEASGDLGIFKSLDGGMTWSPASNGIAAKNIQALAIDPVHTQTLYAATLPAGTSSSSAVYKSTDGASTWTLADTAPFSVAQLAVDAQNGNVVWEIGQNLRKSTDGGSTWNAVTFPGTVQSAVLDPHSSGTVYAISNMVFCGFQCSQGQPPYFYRTVDGGVTWTKSLLAAPSATSLLVDGSTNPSTLYDGPSERSVDGGMTWTQDALPPATNTGFGPFAVDRSGTLYLVASVTNQIFTSHDHAQTWSATGSFLPVWTSPLCCAPSIQSLVPAGSAGALYATTNQVATSGFVTKLSADGSSMVFSTYLRGHASMEFFADYLAEPNAMILQNSVSGIALDPAGNVVVAGETRAVDFPVVAATQASSAGLADAFVATISSDGSQLTESTYFGGSQDDGALAAAVDSQGNVIFAGQTWSYDFPVSGSPNGAALNGPGGYGDSFVVKLGQSAPPTITSVVNGASFQPYIEAGSWVTILGSNLANTSPGQTWTGNDIVNGNLPTSLKGVSVTIDGKPAFVEYVSPTQLNVQSPADPASGPVSVVVNNNGALSAPATVQLQPAAPAFFTYGGTNYVNASRYPDYAPVGNPAVVPGTTPAKPGDILILWGTGFGATIPPTSPGVVVSGAPQLATTPTVMVGGVQATVLGAGLTSGSVGVYQVNIQLPPTVPAGPVSLQASVNGQQTQAGALLFLAGP